MSARATQIDPEVRKILYGVEWTHNIAKLTSGQLERALYVKVNKVLESLGGKWDKKAKGHIFANGSADDLEMVINQGFYVVGGEKKELQQFFTPNALADEVVGLLEADPSHSFLEPSAGDGALLRALERRFPDKSLQLNVTAVELSNKLCAGLRAGYPAVSIVEGDFLGWEPDRLFDRILMNPPFTKQRDLRHVKRAFSMLAPHGRLVAITAPGWLFRTDKRSVEFNQLVEDHGMFTPVAPGTFKEAGTNIATEIVILRGVG
jgi:phospholipid N-methyltransferase